MPSWQRSPDAVMMRGGYRSTLFTAIEQHSSLNPRVYGHSFALLRNSEPTQHEPWLSTHLQLMAWNSESATAFRVRERAMRTALAERGIDPSEHDAIMLDHDRGDTPAGPLAGLFPSWVDLSARMHPDKRRAFAQQVARLVAEESD